MPIQKMNKTLLALAAITALGTTTAVQAMGEKPTAATAGTAAGTSAAESQHRMATLQTGMLSLESSKLARSKGSNMMVREFAQVEVEEQTTLAEIFKSMYPNAPEVTLPTEAQTKLDALKKLSGAAFDREYVKLQIEGHGMLLDIQDAYIRNATNREEQNVAKLARGQIKEHIMLLKAYEQRMK